MAISVVAIAVSLMIVANVRLCVCDVTSRNVTGHDIIWFKQYSSLLFPF